MSNRSIAIEKTVERPIAMLSEHHDIIHEFSEFRTMIDSLRASDKGFDSLVAKHDCIDDEIRRLKERPLPISDTESEKMKFECTALKDQIYHALRAAATQVGAISESP